MYKRQGIEFIELPAADLLTLQQKGDLVHTEYKAEINKLYEGDTYRPADYLNEVQTLMGYTGQ